MLMPSIFGENLLDDFFNDSFMITVTEPVPQI